MKTMKTMQIMQEIEDLKILSNNSLSQFVTCHLSLFRNF